ncbi:MAG: hypothetical protein KAS62_10075, partial [Candidatus Delongbacteria bacterium]|nr:hypothetical protein [Candidatus Delongbacteria bacterium]
MKEKYNSKKSWLFVTLFVILEVMVYMHLTNVHLNSAISSKKREANHSSNFLHDTIEANLQENNYTHIEFFL